MGLAATRRLIEEAKLGAEHVERLARTLYRAMAEAYRSVLLALARRYGHTQQRVVLSERIRTALAAEARKTAQAAVDTYNRLVARWVERNAQGTEPAKLVAALGAYMRERGRKRSRLILDSAVEPAKLDATVSFYRDNGIEPVFDFRGHEGPPSCLTCTELVRTSPHTVATVLAVNRPHPQCSHSWHVKGVSGQQLRSGGGDPTRITLGRGEPAGALGGQPLLLRVKGQDAAVAEIRRLKAAEGFVAA